MAVLIMNSSRASDVPYGAWLAELDEDLILVCSTLQRTSDGFSAVRAFDDYERNAAVDLAALELAEAWGCRLVIAKAECDILRAARLREMLGVPGQASISAVAYRDKVVMKEYVEKAGIPVPAFVRLESAFDLIAFVRDNSYPVFLKPVAASGASGTEVIRNSVDLESFLARGCPHGYMAEQFVEGDVYHVDGLVLDGDIVFAQPSRYLSDGGCLAFKDDRPVGSHFIDPARPMATWLQALCRRVIDSLPSPIHFAFHLEVFHTAADELVFCEIACRTGGVRINEMIRLGRGIDMDESWIRAQCGLPFDVAAPDAPRGVSPLLGQIVVPPRRGELRRLPQQQPPSWILEYRSGVSATAQFSAHDCHKRKSGDYVASFIVEGRTEREVEQRLREAVDWFDDNVEWRHT